MIRFLDGPLAGRALQLRRAPVFLRATLNGKGEADALDMLDDTPARGETLTAYRRVGRPGAYMLDWTEKGRRRGGRFAIATYALVAEQPPEATMRDASAWRAWCWQQWKGGEPQHTEGG